MKQSDYVWLGPGAVLSYWQLNNLIMFGLALVQFFHIHQNAPSRPACRSFSLTAISTMNQCKSNGSYTESVE